MEKTKIESHFDKVAASYDRGKEKYSYYYSNLKKLLYDLIGANKNVFELGCGTGDLLASLNPKSGYGVDISRKMISIAQIRHKKLKNLRFSTTWPAAKYDYIFLSDVIEHLDNIEEILRQIKDNMSSKTRLINTMANPLWEPMLLLWEKLGWKMEEGPHIRIRYKDIKLIYEKVGLKIIKHDYKLLIPIYIPFITNFINRHFEKPLKRFAFIEYFVARKV